MSGVAWPCLTSSLRSLLSLVAIVTVAAPLSFGAQSRAMARDVVGGASPGVPGTQVAPSAPSVARPRAMARDTTAGASHGASATQVAAEDVAGLLARPLSPGTVVLLAGHAANPAVQKRLAEALKDPNPSVRTVTARAAFVTLSKGLSPALITALSKETHPAAAAEQVRALMFIIGPPADSIVLRDVKRVGGPTATAMAEVLARTRPEEILTFLPALIAAGEPGDLGAPLALACAQHPASAPAIAEAIVASGAARLWQGYLETMLEATRPVPPASLRRALASDDIAVQNATLWHLAHNAITGGPAVPDDVIAAAAPKVAPSKAVARNASAVDANATNASSNAANANALQSAALDWNAYLRELLARARGAQPTAADWASLLKQPQPHAAALTLPLEFYGQLTPAELAALGIEREEKKAGALRRLARVNRSPDVKDDGRIQTMRTLPVFAQGLIADLQGMTACHAPSEDSFAAGDLAYHPDGRVKSMMLAPSRLSRDCQLFARALMTMTIASPERPISDAIADHVMVLFDPKFLACADAPYPDRAVASTASSATPGATDAAALAGALGAASASASAPEAPYVRARKTHAPIVGMPDVAQRVDARGIVRVRATISHTGCVRAAETTRTLHPVFDFLALRNMVEWRFTPAQLGDRPVESFNYFSIDFVRP